MTANDIELMEALASVTIPINTAVSTPIYIGQRSIVGIGMSAAWTAAALTFQASLDNTTWQDVYIGGSEYNETVVANTWVIPTATYLQAPYIRLRSGVTVTPVNQAAERTLTIMLRRFSVK
jgi:hypothetical protein